MATKTDPGGPAMQFLRERFGPAARITVMRPCKRRAHRRSRRNTDAARPRPARTTSFDVPRFAERLSCYTLHIGLADMAYSAFRERWDQVASKGQRILKIARA